jgi:hypothetical protein
MSDLYSNGVYRNGDDKADDKGFQRQAEKQSPKGAAEAREALSANSNPRGITETDRPGNGPVAGASREFRVRHALQGDERSASLDAQHDAARSQARRQWHSDRIHDIYSFLFAAPVNKPHQRPVAHTPSLSRTFLPGSNERGSSEGGRVGGTSAPNPTKGADAGAGLPSLLFFKSLFIALPLSLLLWLLTALVIRGLM